MGSNQYGQLGINEPSVRIKNSPILVESIMDKLPIALACGACHTIISTEDGEVYAWGQGKYGAIGTGNTTDAFVPSFVRFADVRNSKI